MKKLIWLRYLNLILVTFVVMAFNACGGGFDSSSIEDISNSSTGNPEEPENPDDPPPEEPPPADPEDPVPPPPPPPPPPVTGALKEIKIDGAVKTPVALDVITTPSGKWPVSYLGTFAGGKAYLWKYETKPDWWSVCLVRYPVEGDNTVDEKFHQLSLNGTVIPVSVLQGSMKCVDHSEPVTPTIDRIKAAIAAKRVLPYSLDALKKWNEKEVTFSNLKRDKYNALGYNPSRIYGRSSSNNSISYAISGQAGEASSSRGFISGDDALLIASAVANQSAAFTTSSDINRVQVLYGLSVPRLAIWSENHHMLRDPQHPFAGDKAYVNEGSKDGADSYGNEGSWTPPADYPYLSQLEATAGSTYSHTRDEAHLFNHGFAYWLATGDPRAALLQQSIAAYALASTYQGGYSDGRYRHRFGYQRSTMNVWNAMWKLRDVAIHVSSTNNQIFWPNTRSLKMVDDTLKDWKAQIDAMDADKSSAYAISSSIFKGIDLNQDNAYSNFMIQNYGPESAYLFASAGFPHYLKRVGQNFTLRYGRIGGRRGITCAAGSGYPVLESGGVLPYSDENGFVNWITTQKCSAISADNLNDTGIHTALRGYWALKLAQDAITRGWLEPIPGLDTAITKAETVRDATTAFASVGVLDWKHCGVPF